MKREITLKSRALRLCLLIGALFASSSAFAAYTGDAEELILDQEYSFTNLSSVMFRKYYYFTPEEDGTLKVTTSVGNMVRYMDNTYDANDNDGDHEIHGDEGGFTNSVNSLDHSSEMNVTAGVTYYVMYYSSASDEGSIYAHLYTSDDKPTLTYVLPAEGEVLEINDSQTYGNITLSFDRRVDMGTITLYVGDGSVYQRGMSRTSQNGLYVISVRDMLYMWLSEGYANAGDDVWITIEDVYAMGDETCRYGEDGTVELHWLLPKCPVGLVNAEWPEPFLSWWDEGDSAGIAVLTFNGDIGSCREVTIGFGDREGDDESSYYTESLADEKITIEGNVMTIDFTGKSRTRMDMVPNYDTSDIEFVALRAAGVMDTDGAYCYSTSSGSLGSFSASPTYVDLSGDYVGSGPEASTTIKTKPTNGGTANHVNSITITCDAGLTATWYTDEDEGISLSEESIVVYDDEGDEAAHGVKDAFEVLSNGYTFTLSNDITADGNYMLIIPEKFFYVGSGADTYSDEINVSFYVDSTYVDGINSVAADKASGVYYNIAGQRVNAPAKGLYITDGKKVVIR